MRSETFKKVARMSFQSILNLIKEVKLGKVYIENEFKAYTVIKFQTQNKGEMMKKYKIALLPSDGVGKEAEGSILIFYEDT